MRLKSSVQKLSKAKKSGFVVSEFAKETGINLIHDSESHPVWSPFDAVEASDKLYAELKKEKADKEC